MQVISMVINHDVFIDRSQYLPQATYLTLHLNTAGSVDYLAGEVASQRRCKEDVGGSHLNWHTGPL